ncbi:MAG TPA: Ig-like domain-containing protein [Longimicrobium sp.]|jgi:hypothetical protein
MNGRILFRALGALGLAAALACSDGGTTDPTPRTEGARLGVALSVEGTPVVAVTAEVSAPDLPSKLLFSLKVEGGVASGSVEVPAGSDRLVTLRGFDAQGILTHQGSKTVAVHEGTNATLSIVMEPVTGTLPIRASFGSTTVVVSPVLQTLSVGGTAQLKATVVGPDGATVTGRVQWASSNPGAVRVDSMGRVTALAPGREAEVVATYNGIGAPARVIVRGDGTAGTTDETPPSLVALSFAPQPLDLTSADTTLRVSFRATDAGAGVSRVSVTLRSPGGQQSRSCSATRFSLPSDAPTQDVSWSCTAAFSRFSAQGAWTVSLVQLTDVRGASTSLNTAGVQAAGLPTTFTVVSPNEDITPPTLTAFTFTPDSVALGGTGASVTFTISVEDAGAGISSIGADFWRTDISRSLSCFPTLASGTAAKGVWMCSINVVPGTPAGSWPLSAVFVRDRAGNVRQYDPAGLAAAGSPTVLKVVP